MAVYYNEFDALTADWLTELVFRRCLPAGDVDSRDIRDVCAKDLVGYSQCHFFAGIGGWSYALQLAGWPTGRKVWTGSCPCQPFSIAGKREGVKDDRHLWPEWLRLISECRPSTIFGEQVASPDGRAWLDDVSTDLETLDYAVGAADLCAAGVGAPHIRQRLWFGGNTPDSNRRRRERPAEAGIREDPKIAGVGEIGKLGDSDQGRSWRNSGAISGSQGQSAVGGCESRDNANGSEFTGKTRGNWADADWLYCRDEKYRAVEPGTFPLAVGISGRVGRLRGYGNAIVPQVAAQFIGAFMEATDSV